MPELLGCYIKPDFMLCRHVPKQFISYPGGELDHLGQPCPVIAGTRPRFDTPYFAGCGLTFSGGRITVTFTDSDSRILEEQTLATPR